MRATVKKVIKTEIEKRKTEGEEQGTRTWIQFTVMVDENRRMKTEVRMRTWAELELTRS